jgi:predicted phage baseplate assembly protein
LPFRYTPVLLDEVVEVQEWVGRGESWKSAVRDVHEEDLRYDYDPATNEVTGVWVRWYSQPHFYNSTATDRHYVLERSTGLVRFGDGSAGMMPPAGSRIVATYSTGGGVTGNVAAGAIAEPRTALPLIAEAFNPVAASGGADTEIIEALTERGPQVVRCRSRAIAAPDFEWLAREASPEVVRARCLPITGPDGHAQRGWVTLIVVPHTTETRPYPSAELGRRVREYLAARVPATVATHIRVIRPNYVPVSVQAEVIPRRPAEAAEVETRVRENLNRFLHPLTGAASGRGWEFGEVLHLSQIANVIEHTAGVDYVSRIKLKQGDQIFDQLVPVETDCLVCAGDHELTLTVGRS